MKKYNKTATLIDGNLFYEESRTLLEITYWRPISWTGKDGKNHISKQYAVLPKNKFCGKLVAVKEWIENLLYEHPLKVFGILLLVSLAGAALCGYGSYQVISEGWDIDAIFWTVHGLTAAYVVVSIIFACMFITALKDIIEEKRWERAQANVTE